MRPFRFGWLILVAPAALSATACGDTETKKQSAAPSLAGAGGDEAETPAGGVPNGGSSATGGMQAIAGETSGGGGAVAGEGGSAEEPAAGGSGGEGGADGAEQCGPPTSLAILGDYTEPSGRKLWLRDSGKAVTLTRVTPGKPTSAQLPSLWRVTSACSESSALVLEAADGSFTRLDYLAGAASLTLCFAAETATSAELAATLLPADRSNTIDAGCNGGPWTRAVKGGN